MVLNTEQLRQFEEQGFCVCSGFLSRQEVAAYLEDLESICAGATLANHHTTRMEMEPDQPPHGTRVRRVYEPCTYYDRFRALSESAKLLDGVEQLLGRNLVFHYSKINMKPSDIGSVVEWHQDSGVLSTDKSRFVGCPFLSGRRRPDEWLLADHTGSTQGAVVRPHARWSIPGQDHPAAGRVEHRTGRGRSGHGHLHALHGASFLPSQSFLPPATDTDPELQGCRCLSHIRAGNDG